MKNRSLKYLEIQADIEDIFNNLAPEIIGTEYIERISSLKTKRSGLLPAWLFVEAVEQTSAAISITDKQANILYVNKAFCDITGYKPEEVIGNNQSMLSYKSTPVSVYKDLWNTISNHKTWHGQVLNKHKSGSPYLANLTIVPIQDSAKKVQHYLGMHRDVSDHYQAEKQMLNQKQLIESVINASPVAMAVLDENSKVVMDNQQYKKMLSDLHHKEPARLFLELIANEIGDVSAYLAKHQEGFNNIEVRLDNPSSNIDPMWFACSGRLFEENDINADSFFNNASKSYLLLNISNITKQRKQHEENYLQSVKTMLAEEEQIRSIRETLLGTIHQVNQPLNQITAAIQLMKQRGEEGALMDLLNQLRDSCQETVTTLQHCVPEIAPTSINSINLNKMLFELINLMRNDFFINGVVIEWLPYPTLSNIWGAENKLRMLFKQLIDNAIESFNSDKSKNRTIEIKTYSQNQHAHVSITDTGPGIPAENLGKIFQPFFTTAKSAKVGSGMGLVMANEIVRQFDGMMEVDKTYTDGCRFIISFPEIEIANPQRHDP